MPVNSDDETSLSEITILPDGRVYVFGMSQQMLEVLQTLQSGDARLRHLLEQVRRSKAGGGLARDGSDHSTGLGVVRGDG